MGLFLIAGVVLLVLLRFYVHRRPVGYETPLPLASGALGGAGQRVLVLAPHSDDETLGAGGVIRATTAAGGQVEVVLVTNGDGFAAAAEEELRTGRLAAPQYVELGYIRQDETLAALQVLGLPRDSTIFLGYPDRGLAPMWEQYWDYSTLFTSRYTRTSCSPYRNSFQAEAPFCGQNVVDNIKRLITDFGPTQILVSHPNDAHPDHWATFAFVTYALEQLRAEGYDKDRRITVYTYLVHRGDWPVPRGYRPGQSLDPPSALVGQTTRWYSYPLDAATVRQKSVAVDAYRSQTVLMPLYLRSFIRSNELFGVLPEAKAAAVAGDMGSPGAAMDPEARWWGVKPVALDPLDDTLVRRAEKGADLRAVYAAVDDGSLRLLVKSRGTPSSKVQIVFLLSDFGSPEDGAGGLRRGNGSGETPFGATAPGGRTFCRLAVTPPGSVQAQINGLAEGPSAEGLRTACRARMVEGGLELEVALPALGGFDRVFLSVESHIEKSVIDRTEWTVIGLR